VYAELEKYQKDGDWDAAVQLVVEAGDLRAPSFPTNNWYRLRRSLEIIKVLNSFFVVIMHPWSVDERMCFLASVFLSP